MRHASRTDDWVWHENRGVRGALWMIWYGGAYVALWLPYAVAVAVLGQFSVSLINPGGAVGYGQSVSLVVWTLWCTVLLAPISLATFAVATGLAMAVLYPLGLALPQRAFRPLAVVGLTSVPVLMSLAWNDWGHLWYLPLHLGYGAMVRMPRRPRDEGPARRTRSAADDDAPPGAQLAEAIAWSAHRRRWPGRPAVAPALSPAGNGGTGAETAPDTCAATGDFTE
ncbi:MAG TPA: hypothetical protein VK453_07085 [Micromonosporaceae bacterium]|nr:hypothetical protein [Micromonosporaceae bacterium]